MAAQDYEQVTYNGPAGAQIGQSATEKVGFYGVAPVAQISLTQLATTKTTTQLRAELTALQNALALVGIFAVT